MSSEDWLEAGGATTRTLTHTLDELGRRVTLQVTGQNPISYGFDSQTDDLTSIIQDGLTTSLVYDPLGRLSKRSLPNGVSTEWAFNVVGDLTSLVSKRNGVPFDSHSYTLWPAGNISQEVVNGVTWNFQQDDLYRLTQASVVGGSTSSWEYDLAGNRLSQTVDGQKTVYGYGPGNRLTSVNGAPLQYDENGNLTAYGNDVYSWDVRDQLVGLSRPGLTAAFAYDYSGRRSSKTINGVKTSFLYDGDDLVSEITGASVVNTLQSPLIDEPLKRDGLYFTPNHLGSTTTLTNSSGNVVEQYFYLPFGETWQSGGSTNPFQFTGRENDGTGLMYYRSRYYAPEWGRLISEDPIGAVGHICDSGDCEVPWGLETGQSLYSYAGNNPIDGSDPYGYATWWERLRHLFEAGARVYHQEPPTPDYIPRPVIPPSHISPAPPWWRPGYQGLRNLGIRFASRRPIAPVRTYPKIPPSSIGRTRPGFGPYIRGRFGGFRSSGGALGAFATIAEGAGVAAEGIRVVVRYRRNIEEEYRRNREEELRRY